jgi:spore coat protein CotH
MSLKRLVASTMWVLFGALLFPAAPVAHAQTADELFAPATLHDLQVFMNTRDVQQLRDTYLENTYYQADLEWRGMRVRSVAIRSRGFGTRNPVKPGFAIDFDRFAAGQRFLGLQSLVLDNLWQDGSLVRDAVTMALFERLGQPAPREAYTRLFINGEYEGVYSLVEAVDPVFLSRAFGDSGGYAFEYHWLDEFHAEYLGRSLGRYKELFEPVAHESASDTTLYLPLHDLFREINATSSPTWRQSVERLLDVRGFLTHVAIETFVSENDGILGNWAMNNFYLYRPSGSTQHRFIPWDRDNAFLAPDTSILLRAGDNILMRRLLEHSDLREFYLQALERCAREGAWLEQAIVTRANLIRAAAYADNRKSFSNDQFEAGVAFLIQFARSRPNFVIAEVAGVRAER